MKISLLGVPGQLMLGESGERTQLAYEIKNVSGHDLKLAVGGSGFMSELEVFRVVNGAQTPCVNRVRPIRDYKPGHTVAVFGRDTKKQQRDDLYCLDEPGQLKVRVHVFSKGPYGDGWGKLIPESAEIWTGDIYSDEYPVTVREPQGIDHDVYEKYQHSPSDRRFADQIVKEYPSSYYAGAALLAVDPFGVDDIESVAGLASRDREKYVEYVGAAFYDRTGGSPEEKHELRDSPTRKSDRMKIGAQRLRQWMDASDVYLKAHHEDPCGSAVSKKRVIALYLMDRDTDAVAEIRRLAQLKGKQAEEAQAFMKTHGIPLVAKPWWQFW